MTDISADRGDHGDRGDRGDRGDHADRADSADRAVPALAERWGANFDPDRLALLELRAGRPDQARRWIDAAKRDDRTAAMAKQLEPLAHGSGRLYASASIEAVTTLPPE